MDTTKKIYVLKEVVTEAQDVVTLHFTSEDNQQMHFTPGQFVQISLIENELGLSGRQYSITSTPKDEFLSISVKKIGSFSNALHGLKTGDKVHIEGPLGNFLLKEGAKDVVMIAGGIGIAPFFSMAKDLFERGDLETKIYLFYSNKKKEDVVFLKQLLEMSDKWNNLHIVQLLTKEDEKVDEVEEYTRVNASVLKKYLSDLNIFDYFICGSVPFVTDTSKMLEGEGIDQRRIFAELFY